MAGKNRRALGDIANLEINRPITRSFHALLLAKDAPQNQKKLLPDNNKPKKKATIKPKNKPNDVDNNKPKKKAPIKPKPKPKPAPVIKIKQDTVEEEKTKPEQCPYAQSSTLTAQSNGLNYNKPKPAPVEEKTEPESSSSSSRSLTSILTARSKAACGLDYKLTKQIIDIDAQDVNNELAQVEYVEDIYKFYKLVQNESQVHDYMDSQPEINRNMRAIVIDWLIQVHSALRLTSETLYLTINIFDRFLAAETVSTKDLQCVGASAMLIASKYEEIWAPKVSQLVRISGGAYEHKDVLLMEKRILGTLEWNLTVPTPYVFLTRFIKAAVISPGETTMEDMAHFYAELGMREYEITRFCPSMVAAAAVYAACATMKKDPIWHETLEMHTGFTEMQVMECAKMMVRFHYMASTDKEKKVIYTKYSSDMRSAVALFRPSGDLSAKATFC